MTQRRVTLNVGGTRFDTTFDTLQNCPESMLSIMFSGQFKIDFDETDGSVFIDRDGTHFRYILNYLRDLNLDVQGIDLVVLIQLKVESQYYGLCKLSGYLTDKIAAKRRE